MSRRPLIPGACGIFSLAVLIVSVCAGGCKRGSNAAQAPAPPPPPVTVSDVVVRDVPYYLEEIGRCAGHDTVSVMPQVAGRVDAAHFTEGEDVKKGDLLFTIDPRPFKAVVAQAEAALTQNKESLKLAQAEYARVEALKGTSAVSQTEYDQKQSAVAVAEAQVEAAQAALDTANLNLEYCTIRSPINGRTGMRLVDPGNIVKANEGVLVMVQSFDPIYADFTIAEDRLPEVRANMANGRLKTYARLPSDPTNYGATTQPAPRVGELSMLDNAVQPNTGTVRLRATIPNTDRHFWPGQFVNIRLVLEERKDALLVPSAAIQVGQKGPYVYVVRHDDEKKIDIAEMRPVVQGQMQDDLTVISKGLNPNEKVIITGQLMVVPDAPVTVMAPQKNPQVAEAKS